MMAKQGKSQGAKPAMKTQQRHRFFWLSLGMIGVIHAAACQTLEVQEAPKPAPVDGASSTQGQGTTATTSTVLQEVQPSAAEPPAAQRDVASLQTRIATHERQIAALRSELALIKRGLRSGIFEPVAHGESAPSHLDDAPALDLGFEDAPSGVATVAGLAGAATAAPQATPSAPAAEKPNAAMPKDEPYALIESAVRSMEQQDYPSAVLALTTMRQRYPGFADEGLSDVLLGESWNALKSPEKALPPLERFLSVHGSSRLLPRAKLAQADAFSGLGERQKSITLLLEVIALAPETPTADAARARMASLRRIQ